MPQAFLNEDGEAMNIKGMLQAAKKKEKPITQYQLSTDFEYQGLKEYPRPQMQRKQFTILNGKWDLQIKRGEQELYQGPIEVPFSPETVKSGVEIKVQPEDLLIYRKTFIIKKQKEKRLLLHFGAVDQKAVLWINGTKVGTHVGGYLPFSFDISPYIKEGKNEILLRVRDVTDTSFYTKGKQSLHPGGMFYQGQSGIWQTVWMEWVPITYITRLKIVPLPDTHEVIIELFLNEKTEETPMPKVALTEKILKHFQIQHRDRGFLLRLGLEKEELWSPEHPKLYDLTIQMGEDRVSTYFGMRKFSVQKDKEGFPRLCLNNKPYFFWGVLDQGYWPESLMTPVSDEAMIFDIKTMKEAGFVMLRKHCKIEPLRWYYHCDRLGMIVWQDIVNGGETYDMTKICNLPTLSTLWGKQSDENKNLWKWTGRSKKESRVMWRKEMKETLEHLTNVVSLGSWVLFNEGWGQFEGKKNYELAKTIDDSRPIDVASGWFHQNCGDVFSEHNYFFKLRAKKKKQPYVISEYGGYSCGVLGHKYNDCVYGYHSCNTLVQLQQDYNQLQSQVKQLEAKGLSGAVYTQVSDIEEEMNGLLTYDRKVKKITIAKAMKKEQ